jgi:hypothetical protein
MVKAPKTKRSMTKMSKKTKGKSRHQRGRGYSFAGALKGALPGTAEYSSKNPADIATGAPGSASTHQVAAPTTSGLGAGTAAGNLPTGAPLAGGRKRRSKSRGGGASYGFNGSVLPLGRGVVNSPYETRVASSGLGSLESKGMVAGKRSRKQVK